MSEYRAILERVERRVRMPEPAMERLLRRRDRRLRNQRIAAAVVGLAVAVAGIGFGILALRSRPAGRPASGGLPSPGPADDGIVGIVLPTVAIWAVLAALALALFAFWRHGTRPRPRPGQTQARSRTSTATRGTTPTVVPPPTRKGNARKEGAMGTHVEPFPARHTARNAWVTMGALVLLALGVVTGVAIGRATVDEPAPPPEPLGLATP